MLWDRRAIADAKPDENSNRALLPFIALLGLVPDPGTALFFFYKCVPAQPAANAAATACAWTRATLRCRTR